MKEAELGRGTLDRVLSARGGNVPYDAMAEMIELSRSHQDVRRGLLSEIDKQLWNAERDMELAWLWVMAGEVGPEGHQALIDLLGKTESDDVTESAIPALTRHVVEAYEDIKKAIDASGVVGQRSSLYECLRGVVVFGEAAQKSDLAEYATDRVRREMELPAQGRELIGPLRLLVDLGAPDARKLLSEVRAKVRSKTSRTELEGLESYRLGGSKDSLDQLRASHAGDWRDTAENLRKLFHPTKEEKRRLQQLLVSLGDGGSSVH